MSLFGLVGTDELDSFRFKNHRRQILYSYPTGTAPLTALLNLCDEEETDDPEYRWMETRLPSLEAATAYISTTVIFASATVTANVVTAVTAWSADTAIANGSSAAVCVDDTDKFCLNMVVKLNQITLTGGTKRDYIGIVTGIGTVSSKDYLYIRVVDGAGSTTIDFDSTANLAVQVLAIGMSNPEGHTGTDLGAHELPIEQSNYTQIFKYGYQITGTNLKTATKFDKAGSFPDQAKQNAINFAKLLEYAFLFGVKSTVAASGSTKIRRLTGGLLHFMREWEAANSVYRGGSGAAAATANSDDNKRIIDLASETLTLESFTSYLERMSRTSGGSNTSNELLCFTGNQAFLLIQKMLKTTFELQVVPKTKDTYMMDFVKVVTPMKTIMFMTHPLFNENALLRRNRLLLEPGNLCYRNLKGRDMQLTENQQPNNADYREDAWFGECGLEVHYPEKMMYLTNLTTVG